MRPYLKSQVACQKYNIPRAAMNEAFHVSPQRQRRGRKRGQNVDRTHAVGVAAKRLTFGRVRYNCGYSNSLLKVFGSCSVGIG